MAKLTKADRALLAWRNAMDLYCDLFDNSPPEGCETEDFSGLARVAGRRDQPNGFEVWTLDGERQAVQHTSDVDEIHVQFRPAIYAVSGEEPIANVVKAFRHYADRILRAAAYVEKVSAERSERRRQAEATVRTA